MCWPLPSNEKPSGRRQVGALFLWLFAFSLQSKAVGSRGWVASLLEEQVTDNKEKDLR
jgi:hypothetical protein